MSDLSWFPRSTICEMLRRQIECLGTLRSQLPTQSKEYLKMNEEMRQCESQSPCFDSSARSPTASWTSRLTSRSIPGGYWRQSLSDFQTAVHARSNGR